MIGDTDKLVGESGSISGKLSGSLDSGQKVEFNKNAKEELQIPFIYFFQDAIRAGVISSLDDINKLKNQNQIYSKYIDRWIDQAATKKEIVIASDGSFVLNPNSEVQKFKVDKDSVNDIMNPLSKMIVDVATKDLSKEKREGVSSLNVFSYRDTPENTENFRNLVKAFRVEASKLLSKPSGNEKTERLHYLSISSCTINQEVLSEI